MAGAGYKLFNTGDVLTAAQVNTYLQEQTVMVFANSTARTTALSGVLAEGMVSYLQDTNAVEVYNGSAWVGVSGAGDVTEVQAGTGISVASGTGPIPVVTNTMATAIDAKGDLVVGTGADTFARLAVGATNGHSLQVDSSTATGLKWAAAGSGALTKITSASFTTQSSVTVDDVFTSTYKRYQIIICATGSVGDATLQLQMRYSGSTETGTNYFGPVLSCNRTGVTWVQSGFVSTSSMNIIGSSTTSTGLQTDTCGITMYATNVGNASESPRLWWSGTTGADLVIIGSGRTTTARTYTGFLIKPDSGTISGSYQVFGLEN